jgi:amidophosphoribosyltransferase
MALAHNGNITNTSELHAQCLPGMLQPMTTSDSELIMVMFSNIISEVLTKRSRMQLVSNINAHNRSASPRPAKRTKVDYLSPANILQAANELQDQMHGGYAVVMVLKDLGILAFRDVHGVRPLVLGKRVSATAAKAAAPVANGSGSNNPQQPVEAEPLDYMLASESAGLDALGFQLVRDIAPGEAVFIDLQSNIHTHMCESARTAQFSPCIFEYVYFARPDSIVNGVSVHESRSEMGISLGKSLLERFSELQFDVIIPVPDTSRPIALSCVQEIMKSPQCAGVRYAEGFVKNRYIARTFIIPGQANRERNVKMKFNVVKSIFAGKAVVLIDDSIVRGTTSRKLVQLAREAGATQVYFASASPPIRYENVYGIDMPCRTEVTIHHALHHYTVHCTLYTVHYTHGALYSRCTVLYSLCTVLYPLYTVHCTLYSYTTHCTHTLHTVLIHYTADSA